MSGLILTVTDAGRAALVNAANNGTAPVLMSAVGLSATAFAPTPDATGLPGETKRLETITGDVAADDTIHVTIRDESADTYTVRALALYLEDGTLFALYGQAEPIMEKSAQAMLLLAIDVIFANIDAQQISFGDVAFTNPPATTERLGVVELATSEEATAGVDTIRAVTPKGLKAAVTNWLNSRFGEGAPSDFVKSLLTAVSAAALRAALEIKSAALRSAEEFAAAVHGHGITDISGLQTALGGKAAASHDHVIGNITGLQAALDGKAAASHGHVIGNVTGLQAALDGKLNNGTNAWIADSTGRWRFKFDASASYPYTRIGGNSRICFHVGSSSGTDGFGDNEHVAYITTDGEVFAKDGFKVYSDIRLKTDLQRIEGALDRIEMLMGCDYTYVPTGKRSTGLIAQDVQKAKPEAVSEGDGGYLTVNLPALMGLIVEAIKELRAEVNGLKAAVIAASDGTNIASGNAAPQLPESPEQ